MEEIIENEVVEDVELTTEELEQESKEKSYSQSEVDNIVSKRLSRQERKIRNEYNKKYGTLENTLKAGLDVPDMESAERELKKYYENNGVVIPKMVDSYSNKDIEILANAEANEIIDLGKEEMIYETNKFNEIGYDNLSERDKIIFTKLARKLTDDKRKESLKEVGADDEVLNSKEFTEFSKKFNSDTNIKDIYELYEIKNSKNKKMPKPIGTVKNQGASNEVKEFYSYDESKQFSREDYNNNPQLFKAVCDSMSKW